VVPPYLGSLSCLNKIPVGDAQRGKGQPASLMGYGPIGSIFNRLQAYTLCLDNGGSSGTGYCPLLSFRGFDWQLGGPFGGGVRTGIAPFPGSLRRRVNAYSSSSTLFLDG